VDVQEFEHLEFPVARFDPALLEALRTEAAETVEVAGDKVVLHHIFTERRLAPLNLYLRDAEPPAGGRPSPISGGDPRPGARQHLPRDLLLKNFGLTRQGRVVFYDYDEISFLTEMNFREMPGARRRRGGDEPAFYVGENDVFPEEFMTFLASGGRPGGLPRAER